MNSDEKVLKINPEGLIHWATASRARFGVRAMLALVTALSELLAAAAGAQPVDALPAVQLDAINVTGKTADSLHGVESEFDLVGPANQPEWTTRRAFAETDIYVIPPGEIEFNQFYISSHPRHDKPKNLFESEFEFGLPWRTQCDLELKYSIDHGRLRRDGVLVELPHALADWGEISLNPTIDAGWRFNARKPDAYFISLLLAEDFGKKVHFGAGLSFENQIAGEREQSYELNTAFTYSAIDTTLSLGAELLLEHETERTGFGVGGANRVHSTSLMAGPIVLFKPTLGTHLGLMPLFGLTNDAPVAEVFVVFGVDLEPFRQRRAVNDRKEENSGPSQLFRRRR